MNYINSQYHFVARNASLTELIVITFISKIESLF